MVIIMKGKKVFAVLAAALIGVSSFALGSAHAANTSEPITASLSYDVSINYNGTDVTMKNVNGERVYPILYQGTTYIPIRAMGNLFGVPVDWDGATRTVLLGDSANSEGFDLIDNYEPYAVVRYCRQVQSTEGKTAFVGGVKTNHWLTLQSSSYACYGGAENTDVYYNIGGKYRNLSFEVTSAEDTTLFVYGDNEYILAEIPLTAHQTPQKININLQNTTQLHFQAKLSSNYPLEIINAYLT